MKKNKKTKKTGGQGRISTISKETMEEMFTLFIKGESIAAIAKKYNMSRHKLYHAAKRDEWKERKEEIDSKVSKEVDKKILGEMLKGHEKQMEIIWMALSTVYEDVKEDYENRNNPVYKRKVKLDSTADLERLFKVLYLIQNNGVEKTQNLNINEGTLKIDNNDRKLLLRAIASGNAVVVDDDEGDSDGVVGNA